MVACAQEPVGGNATEATPLTAADAQAYRWQAMANWYERHGLLNLDSEAAADAHAYRWQAMANWYERQGLLNLDSEAAADQSETAADLPEN